MTVLDGIIAVAISGILLGTITSATVVVFKEQSKNRSLNAMLKLAEQIEESIKNPVSWSLTLNAAANNASLGCLRPGTGATCNSGVQPPFQLLDDQGNVLVNGLVATAGFAPDGSACNLFSAIGGNGSDQCPFRYSMTWTATCVGGDPCKNPQIQVDANLTYNPRGATQFVVNENLFNVSVYRSSAVGYETLEIIYRRDPGQEGGTCNAGTWANRRSVNTVVEDSANNVVNVAGGRFVLRDGTYECDITSRAHGTNGFKVRLRDVTNGINYIAGQGFALNHPTPGVNDSSATIKYKVFFTITANATFELQQFCESTSAPSGLGKAIAGAGGTLTSSRSNVYSIVACTRTI